jgi:hypothetical protein
MNAATGNGGGIYTEDESYTNLNITSATSPGVRFTYNTAGPGLYKLSDAHKISPPKAFSGYIGSLSAPALNAINFGPLWISGTARYYGSNPGGILEADASRRSVFNNYDINYTDGTLLPTTATLTLSSTVTGDASTPFEFTLYLKAWNNAALSPASRAYTGGVIENSDANPPAGGTLTFASDGKADVSVSLTDGQLITITGLPLGTNARIEQITTGYITSFQDSIASAPETASDTGERILAELPRVFAFTNSPAGPPTGVSMGNTGVALPLAMMICGLWLLHRSITDLRRRRSPAWEH